MEALKLLTRGSGVRVQISKPQDHTLPSQGAIPPPAAAPVAGQKRKRSEYDVYESGPEANLSHEQVRQTQKRHRIKIVNLQKLRKARKQISETSRKQVKESARLFPQPLTMFPELTRRYTVNNALVSNIAEQGYFQPTEVQIAALPLLLEDHNNPSNLLTVAPTGSGKTLAFLLPLIDKLRLQHAQARDASGDLRSVRAVILAPTKELVGQLVNEGRKLCVGTGVTITAMRKGMKLTAKSRGVASAAASEDQDDSDQPLQRQALVKSDILVSTPLSLLRAILDGDETPLVLPAVETLILDEADVLLDPLFREQTLSIWSALTSSRLHVSFWSATVGSNIEELAVSTITQRRRRLGIKKRPAIVRVVVGLKDSSLPSISHKLIYAGTEAGKLLGLRQILRPQRQNLTSSTAKSTQPPALRPPFLVFTQTIDRATALFQELQYEIPAEAGGSSRIAMLHSSLSSSARSATMTKFRKGEIWILMTTDLLSRGIDFKGINGVVNYDIPTTSGAYVHRAGRTGRAGRIGGVCVTLWTNDDIKYLKPIVSVIQSSQENDASGQAPNNIDTGLERWLVDLVPELSKKDRRELKNRGVETRRAVKTSDDDKQRKKKRKAKIGTKSGYERQLENRRKGAAEGSKRRREQEADEGWDGFD